MRDEEKKDGFAFNSLLRPHPSSLIITLSADELVAALLRLDAARGAQILDSGGARGVEARFLIAGCDPFETIEARDGVVRVSRHDDGSTEPLASPDVLRVLDERLASYRVPHEAASTRPACGACIATFSYDLGRRFERLRSHHRTQERAMNNSEPDATLAFYDTLIIHDYLRATTEIVSVGGAERLNQMWEMVTEAARLVKADSQRTKPDEFNNTATSNFTRDEYTAAVQRIKEHIAAGDIYQANLTQQFTVALNAQCSPERIFLNLRRDHPASFAAFLRHGEDVVISASPERFLRVAVGADGERSIEAWPIKGTRPRGSTVMEDRRLRAELMGSEKDRAENVMIVDLVRNDLGRVCRYGSVEVSELFTIQEHPTLFHLVSKVCGQLRESVTAGDILRAAFPCGSITGAPKIRAMEIIDEIEPDLRGLSMGAIGYFSFDGAMDLNVAIRTMTIRDSMARFNVGGGIVADSDPLLEYEESLTKAHALLRALGVSPN